MIQEGKKIEPKHLLWGLLLMKAYSFETINSSMATADEKTFRKWSHAAIEDIADLHAEVVSLLFCSFSFELYIQQSHFVSPDKDRQSLQGRYP